MAHGTVHLFFVALSACTPLALRLSDDKGTAGKTDSPDVLVTMMSPNLATRTNREANNLGAVDCGKDYILQWTLGKSGTTTLSKSIGDYCGYKIAYESQIRNEYRMGIKPQKQYEVALDFLAKIPDNSTVWIIQSVRNPFPWSVSGKFQTLEKQYGTCSPSLNEVMDDYHRTLESKAVTQPSSFFSTFTKHTGIDPLQLSFNHTTKSMTATTVLNGKRLQFLLIRFEDISEWEKILNPYFPGIAVGKENVGDDKCYAELYAQFKESRVYTPEEIKMVNKSPLMHFYTREEQDAIQ